MPFVDFLGGFVKNRWFFKIPNFLLKRTRNFVLKLKYLIKDWVVRRSNIVLNILTYLVTKWMTNISKGNLFYGLSGLVKSLGCSYEIISNGRYLYPDSGKIFVYLWGMYSNTQIIDPKIRFQYKYFF